MKKKNNNVILFGIVGIVILAMLTVSFTKSDSKLSGADFIEKYNNTPNAMLVDVRTPAEFLAGHIDKAINIDFENQSFGQEIKKLNTTNTYFVYCRSGNRSGQAITLMKSFGISSIYDLKGGLSSNNETIHLVTQ